MHGLCAVTSNMRFFVSLFRCLTCRALVGLLKGVLLPGSLGVLGLRPRPLPQFATLLAPDHEARQTVRDPPTSGWLVSTNLPHRYPRRFTAPAADGCSHVLHWRKRGRCRRVRVGARKPYLAVWPDRPWPPLRLHFEIHMESELSSAGKRSHTACVECALSVCDSGA